MWAIVAHIALEEDSRGGTTDLDQNKWSSEQSVLHRMKKRLERGYYW